MPRYVGPVPRAQAKEGSMPQLVKKRRSAWAVLAVAAMFASLLAVAASPVGAAEVGSDDASPNSTTKLSACIGDALKDNGFTDVSDGHAFKDHINCIAYYKITLGTDDGTTFSPSDNISRAQAATMILRAAKAAGADLDDAMGDDKFDDIEDVFKDFRDAINVLAENEVITAGGDFKPNDDITREDMAAMVAAMLKAASNVYGSNGQLTGVTYGGTGNTLDHFKDALATSPGPVNTAISELYELGVALGTDTSGVFNPKGLLTRGQMAAFITRALAHTSVRPAGVTAQWDGKNIVVSARTDAFAPKVGVVVDLFHIATADADSAVKTDGTCDTNELLNPLRGELCEIDNSDSETRNSGDFSEPLETDDVGEGVTVWVWTGDVGDTFGSDTDVYRLDIAKGEATPVVAARAHITSDLKGVKAKLGSTVVYTVQLQDSTGKATTIGSSIVEQKPASFLVTLSAYAYASPPTTRATRATSVTPLTITTDSEGKATFSVTAPADPDKDTFGDKFSVDITIQSTTNGVDANMFYIDDSKTPATNIGNVATVISGSTNAPEAGLIFSTEKSKENDGDGGGINTTVELAAEYLKASAEGVRNSVTAKLVDQYGDPIVGKQVVLVVTTPSESGRTTRRTLRDGSVTFDYTRKSATAATETVTVTWLTDEDTPASQTNTAMVEWATEAGDTNGDSAKNILAFDTDTNTIFAGAAGEALVLTYDSNDRFDVMGEASNYAAFEKALSTDHALTWRINKTRPRPRDVNTFRLVAGS